MYNEYIILVRHTFYNIVVIFFIIIGFNTFGSDHYEYLITISYH